MATPTDETPTMYPVVARPRRRRRCRQTPVVATPTVETPTMYPVVATATPTPALPADAIVLTLIAAAGLVQVIGRAGKK